LETNLEDFARARGIYELGVSQSPLSGPENLWKSYIDFEITEGERELARALYERLISLSGHLKVWISYAEFEAEGMRIRREERSEEEDDEEEETWAKDDGDLVKAREVWERAYKDLKAKGLKGDVRISSANLTTVLTFILF
jgi:crooked neck